MEDRKRTVDEEFGLESVMKSHNKFVKTRSDIAVVWIHYIFLRNLMKSLGGDNAITEKATEVLPRNLGWNGEKQSYLLKYCLDDRVFALGIWVRGNILDCSFVTLQRSLKIGIPIDAVIRPDLSVYPEVVDKFTDDVEREFVCPLLSSAT